MQETMVDLGAPLGGMCRRRGRTSALVSAWPGLGVPTASAGAIEQVEVSEHASLTLPRASSAPPPGAQHTVSVLKTLVIGVMMLFSGILLGRSLQLGQAEARMVVAPQAPQVRTVLPSTQTVGPVIETPVAIVSRPPMLVPPPGHRYTVQIVALEKQSAARVLAGELSVKGWPAYVQDFRRQVSTPVYRVRVGRFADRDAAERARLRLEKEEQLIGWIARL